LRRRAGHSRWQSLVGREHGASIKRPGRAGCANRYSDACYDALRDSISSALTRVIGEHPSLLRRCGCLIEAPWPVNGGHGASLVRACRPAQPAPLARTDSQGARGPRTASVAGAEVSCCPGPTVHAMPVALLATTVGPLVLSVLVSCIIEAPCLVNGGHGGSLRQPSGGCVGTPVGHLAAGDRRAHGDLPLAPHAGRRCRAGAGGTLGGERQRECVLRSTDTRAQLTHALN
jgi:hypothetical protein